jgi:hypothetical protein
MKNMLEKYQTSCSTCAAAASHTLFSPRAAFQDTDEKCFFVDIAAEQIKNEPGFDRDHWPSMADAQWGATVHHYYNRDPYWSPTRAASEGDD